MKIEVGKRYIAGNREGQVIAIDRKHRTHTVVFLADNGDISSFRADGGYYSSGESSEDLQEIPKSIWLNVYDGIAFPFSSREKADESDQKMTTVRLACIEVKEGDGL